LFSLVFDDDDDDKKAERKVHAGSLGAPAIQRDMPPASTHIRRRGTIAMREDGR